MEKNTATPGSARAKNQPLKLSFLSVIFYLLAAFVIIALLNLKVIWHFVLGSSTAIDNQANLVPLTDDLVRFLGRLSAPILMIFWAAFGAAVYGFIWLAQNVIFTVEKQVEESRYLKGGVVPVKNYWHRILTSNLAFAGALVAWLFYATVFLAFLLPMASKLFFVAFYEPSTPRQVLDVVGAVLSTAVALYVLRLSQYFLRFAWRASRP